VAAAALHLAPGESQDASAPPPRAAVAAFTRVENPDAAETFTRELASSHYENFSVVSKLLPADLRQDFANIYAFCRIADDLGDEIPDQALSTKYLAQFRAELRDCYAGRASSAVFVALRRTIDRHDIPIEPFHDLISAFEQDQQVKRYETFEQLLDYCRRSANPVGRLVLYVTGYRDEERQRLSDSTCTALQLANFWQDIARDLRDLDRIYIPHTSMEKFGVNEEDLRADHASEGVRKLVRFEVDRTEELFAKGDALLPLLDASTRRHVALFGMGGRAVLDAIRRQDFDTLRRRPVLSAWQKGRLIARVAANHVMGMASSSSRRITP